MAATAGFHSRASLPANPDEQIAALEASLADQDALLSALQAAVKDEEDPPPAELLLSPSPTSTAGTGLASSPLKERASSSSSSTRRGPSGESWRGPRALATFAGTRAVSGPNLSYASPGPSARLGTLPESQKVVVGLAGELADLRAQRTTARGALARAQRDRTASETELGAARHAVPDMRARAEQLRADVQDRTSALTDATAKAERAEAQTAELDKAGSEWDARVEALEKECADVARGCKRLGVQMDALQAAWNTTRPAWASELDSIRAAAKKRTQEREVELAAVRSKTAKMESLAEQRESERGDLLAVLDQWQTQRDRLLGLLKNKVPVLSDDLAKATAASVPTSPHPGSKFVSSPRAAGAPRKLPMASHYLLSPGTPSALDQQIDRAVRDVQDIVRRARSGQV